mmetsp:Transcript_5414/g.12019  ORF Transcript_5414/g.12019 Transcript_5414/m.12019 type:complete len:253 (+) Transcript_5414:21-779(+)
MEISKTKSCTVPVHCNWSMVRNLSVPFKMVCPKRVHGLTLRIKRPMSVPFRRREKKEGTGREIYSDKSTYHGTFVNNKRCGKGQLTNAKNELLYDGEWNEDCITGYGTRMQLTKPCLGMYVGEWKNGKRHGHGTFTCQQEQSQDNNNQENDHNGFMYEGQWNNDKPMDGDWVLTNPNGSVYYGSAIIGPDEKPVAHGFGTQNQSNGDFYSGTFQNGQRHGSGLCVFHDSGEQWDGKWEHDVYVKYGRQRPGV